MVNAGFNPLNEISKLTGKSMAELRKDMENGAISAKMVVQAFQSATSSGGRFYNAMQAQSKTFAGQMSTLKDNIKSALGDAMKPAFDTLTNEVLPNFVKQINNSDSTSRKLIGTLGSLANVMAKSIVPVMNALSWMGSKVSEGFKAIKDAVGDLVIVSVEALKMLGNAFIGLGNAVVWAFNKVTVAKAGYMDYMNIKDVVSTMSGSPSRKAEQDRQAEKDFEKKRKLAKYKATYGKSDKFDPFKEIDYTKITGSVGDGLDKVKDKIADKMKDIANQVKSKAESIRDAFDIFSSPKMEKLGWKDLRYRMQKQLRLMEQWKSAMNTIGQKMGTESPIYRATLAQGPQAVGQAMALASMPNKDLLNFANQYNQKQAIGMQFAAQQQAWQMKADNINQNITFNITESTDSDKVVQEVTKKLKLVGVM